MTQQPGSIRTPILQEDAYLIERVNAGMGEWEYVIQYCGEYYATAPSEEIARDIVERAQWSRPAPQQQNLSCLGQYDRDPCLMPACPIKVMCREYTELRKQPPAPQQPCNIMTCTKADDSCMQPPAPADAVLDELDKTIWMLYEFCEWFCDYDCEEKPCTVTVSRLHERLEGIQKQMKEHPEYLEKWKTKRAEQAALRAKEQQK